MITDFFHNKLFFRTSLYFSIMDFFSFYTRIHINFFRYNFEYVTTLNIILSSKMGKFIKKLTEISVNS